MQRNNSPKKIIAQIVLLYFRTTSRFAYDYMNCIRTFLFIPKRLKSIKFKFLIGFIILVIFFCYILLISNLQLLLNIRTTPTPLLVIFQTPQTEQLQSNITKDNSFGIRIPSEAEFRRKLVEKKIERLAKHSELLEMTKLLSGTTPLTVPSTRVHLFYYTSYGNLAVDGQWKLWTSNINSNNSGDEAPDSGSSYYPMLGCYSSQDPLVISTHFKQIRDAGVGVVAASWNPHEDIFSKILNYADKYQLKVTPHLQAFKDSNVITYIQNITSKYINHPAFYKIKKNGRLLPVYYIHESYRITVDKWREILASDATHTIRETSYDGVFIGLVRDNHHKYHVKKSSFDGFYTYFSSNGYSYGSTWKNWKALKEFAIKHKLLFFPSVSPGYIDTRVHPWNAGLTRHRSRGHYYQVAWRSALAESPAGVTITSFNDWQQGSQIEPATTKTSSNFKYLDYTPEGPFFYLNLTRYWVKQFVSLNNIDKNDISIKL